MDTLLAWHGEGSAFRDCCARFPEIARSAHPPAPTTCTAFIVPSSRRSFRGRLGSVAKCSGGVEPRRLC